jgi:hypothetical protein
LPRHQLIPQQYFVIEIQFEVYLSLDKNMFQFFLLHNRDIGEQLNQKNSRILSEIMHNLIPMKMMEKHNQNLHFHRLMKLSRMNVQQLSDIFHYFSESLLLTVFLL